MYSFLFVIYSLKSDRRHAFFLKIKMPDKIDSGKDVDEKEDIEVRV